MGAGENQTLTMPGKLEGQTCLITGSTGIAAATAELAVREGSQVFVASRTREHGAALMRRLRSLGGDVAFMAADLTSAKSAARVADGCAKRFHRIDAVFNVAGISGRKFGDGAVHECTEEGWDITMATNVKSMFLVCRSALKYMLQQPLREDGQRGIILNMASVLGFSPSPRYFGTHAYAASKGAIIGLSKSMAATYAPHKIRVNVIAPALVRTPMSARAQQSADVLRFIRSKQPLVEDLIEPDAVARAAIFLLSGDAMAITGDVLTVDAGWVVSEGQ
jgi:NAD(P)-dependent dehydrogenase (short-subunit alcohol dehydrogenase family)